MRERTEKAKPRNLFVTRLIKGKKMVGVVELESTTSTMSTGSVLLIINNLQNKIP